MRPRLPDPARIVLPVLPAGRAIPRRLHHIFLPGRDRLPAAVRAHLDSLAARNPGWEVRLLDAAGAAAFVAEAYGPEVLALYEAIDPAYYAARADLLRYLLVYRAGGVYLDVKSGADRPLDAVLRPDDVFLLSQWPGARGRPASESAFRELRHVAGGEYQQWWLAAAPGHPFLLAVIREVLGTIGSYGTLRHGVGAKGVLRTTGPIAFTLAIAPIRHLHPHRMVAAETDLAFRYRAVDDLLRADAAAGRHYAQLARPVVRRGPLETALAEALLPPAKRLWALWRRRLAKPPEPR